MLSDIAKSIKCSILITFLGRIMLSWEILRLESLLRLSVKEQEGVITNKTKDFLERYLELEDILGVDSHFVNPNQRLENNFIFRYR